MRQEGAAGPAATATDGMTFDYLVSACWASEWDGREIEVVKGKKMRVFSSLGKALAAGAHESRAIFVCPGEYRERRWWQFWRK